jgi:hypothetical protein
MASKVVELFTRSSTVSRRAASIHFGYTRIQNGIYPAVFVCLPNGDETLLVPVASLTVPINDLPQYCPEQPNKLFEQWEKYALKAGLDLTIDATLYRKSDQGWMVIE